MKNLLRNIFQDIKNIVKKYLIKLSNRKESIWNVQCHIQILDMTLHILKLKFHLYINSINSRKLLRLFCEVHYIEVWYVYRGIVRIVSSIQPGLL